MKYVREKKRNHKNIVNTLENLLCLTSNFSICSSRKSGFESSIPITLYLNGSKHFLLLQTAGDRLEISLLKKKKGRHFRGPLYQNIVGLMKRCYMCVRLCGVCAWCIIPVDRYSNK